MKNQTYQHIAGLLKGRSSRKIGNNTYVRQEANGSIALRLHATDILTAHSDGTVTVNSGGWQTVTTKARLNDHLQDGLRIHQTKGIWYWSTGQTFIDGQTISVKGKLPAESKESKDTVVGGQRALLKAIAKYAKLCADSVPMAAPSGGDCWGCHYRDSEGKEVMGTDHFHIHMAEGYVVPSLVYQALKDAGNGPVIMAGAFKTVATSASSPEQLGWIGGLAKDRVQRAVRRYLKRRLGLAG